MNYLPKEIVVRIYEYDNTYRSYYKKVIGCLNRLPIFVCCDRRFSNRYIYKLRNQNYLLGAFIYPIEPNKYYVDLVKHNINKEIYRHKY